MTLQVGQFQGFSQRLLFFYVLLKVPPLDIFFMRPAASADNFVTYVYFKVVPKLIKKRLF